MSHLNNSLPGFAGSSYPELPLRGAVPPGEAAVHTGTQKTATSPKKLLRDSEVSHFSSFSRSTGLADRYPWRSFAILSIFYLIVVAGMSWTKLFWLDELITLHIARLGSATSIWRALSVGADPNPPAIHLLVMVFRNLFGEHAFVLRLPAAIGYWVGMLALFLFLKRRVPVLWALAGIVLSMAMGGFAWSYESRSYAVFYGFTMLAFYCWTRWADCNQTALARYLALAGMTFSLAAGLCTNYFATLAFFPIAAAEATRIIVTLRRSPGHFRAASIFRFIDWPVILALAIAATPLLLFRSLIATSIARYAPYAWNKVAIDTAIAGYMDMLTQVLWLLIGLFALALMVELLTNLRSDVRAKIWPQWFANFVANPSEIRRAKLLDYPEAAAVATFVAYPFIGFALAYLRGGMLSARFVIPVCFGGAIAGTLLAYRLFGAYRRGANIALTVVLLGFVARQSWIGYNYQVQKESFYRVVQRIPPPEYPGQPVALGDNLLVLPLQYYAPPQLASRIVYPVDFEAIVRDRGEASGEINFWTGRNAIYDFPIIPLAQLQRTTTTYIVVTSGPDWLVEDLRRHNYRVDPLPIDTEAAEMDFIGHPVGHGKPYLFRASGDLDTQELPTSDLDAPPPPPPVPFDLSSNLPKTQ